MKEYKIDININDSSYNIIPLKGNSLFYWQMGISSEGPWIDESIRCHLIEFSKNDYADKTNILPDKSDYNILYEISDDILLVGSYHKRQNNDMRDRIVKLVKKGEIFEQILEIKQDGL